MVLILDSRINSLLNMLTGCLAFTVIDVCWVVAMFLIDWMGEMYSGTCLLL
jgi:hypothetical protein